MRTTILAGATLLFAGAWVAACGADDTTAATGGFTTTTSGPTTGSGGSTSDTTNSGAGGDLFTTGVGVGGSGGVEECAGNEQEATIVIKPVDIIFVIDNSGSMGGEIQSVQDNINLNFASIIEASGLDYRVIMVARHGNLSSESICVAAPLSGTDCVTIPAQPAENPPKFYHHSVEIASHDAWCKLLEQYDLPDEFGLHPNGYKDLLRPEASKTFVVITDDSVSCTFNGVTYSDGNSVANGDTAAQAFDASLLALSPTQFGTAAERNYVFHSLVALAPYDNSDLTLPHPVNAPVITAECSPGAANPGTGYQALSVLTGGLRYPTCGNDYTTIFNEIAIGVIEGAKVDCEFPVPTAPVGETIDLATVAVVYTPGDGGAPKTYAQVADASLCGPGLFYIEAGTIKLCPETCDEVQSDDNAAVKIVSGCEPGQAT